MNKRVLCLLVDGFEEIETLAPVDLLRRAGAEVIMASLTGQRHVTGRCNVVVQADTLLNEVIEQEFDLLLIPGGPGVKALRKDGRAAQLAQQYSAAGKTVAAICAAPTILFDAGLLANKQFTAHHSVQTELPKALMDKKVVEDGNIITSRGAGTALEFGLALVGSLYGEATRNEIAQAIMF